MESILFEKTRIKTLSLDNRLVRSATWEGLADAEGRCTPELIRHMETLARGGVGLIITGHAFVEKRGQAGVRQMGIHTDAMLDGLHDMTAAVHGEGGKIVAQLAHSGISADPALTKGPPMAISRLERYGKHKSLTMKSSDFTTVADAFGRAAFRAIKAGFDGVQIHAAHGYLLSQSISPFFNHRTDRYGGSAEKRRRFLLEVLESIRSRVGDDYPVLIKMNTSDFLEGGLVVEESLNVARALVQKGIDAIELSGGTGASGKLNPVRSGIRQESDEAYFRSEAAVFRRALKVPLALVGGIRSFRVAEKIVTEGLVDYISMSRPFIREPELINRWRRGDLAKSACLSDSRCFVPARTGKGLFCVIEAREKKEHSQTE
jgi:2,4-dienoyl-CoA reductase-like NADH-dependent reductase (Old Yellow Enzyme family)